MAIFRLLMICMAMNPLQTVMKVFTEWVGNNCIIAIVIFFAAASLSNQVANSI